MPLTFCRIMFEILRTHIWKKKWEQKFGKCYVIFNSWLKNSIVKAFWISSLLHAKVFVDKDLKPYFHTILCINRKEVYHVRSVTTTLKKAEKCDRKKIGVDFYVMAFGPRIYYTPRHCITRLRYRQIKSISIISFKYIM